MDTFPHTSRADSTLAFLRQGYAFFALTCDTLKSDFFMTRLLGRPVVCMRGPEAVSAFYVPGRFTRRGAIPATTVSLLQDFGSVQTLDGARHRQRKRMFLSLMNGESMARGRAILAEEWVRCFSPRGPLNLLDTAHLVCCRTALRWCGLEHELPRAPEHTVALRAMIDGAGSLGYAQLRGQLLRRREERWARHMIARLRAVGVNERTPASSVAFATEEDGTLLSEETAAIELINLLRPMVAVARFFAFAAHALHLHPEWRDRLAAGPRQTQAFAQEVRRFYPFFPAVGGRVLAPFKFRGRRFEKNAWVLLDLYGTNHHTSWGDPQRFRPERFLEDGLTATRLVAQGGGGHLKGHRCAGEDLTVTMIEEACGLLARMEYDVPKQNLSIPLNRFPTAPKDGMKIMLH